MYLIDKLKIVNKSTQIESVEFNLSKYLLTNLNNIKNLSLKTICLETKLSKSSIIRFCQRAGYEGFTVFLDELNQEADELKDTLKSYQNIDLFIYDALKKDYIKRCENQAKEAYVQLVDAIKNSHKVLLYGHDKYISCFSLLSSYLYTAGNEVIDNMCWDIEKQKLLFTDLNESDLIIIIEPYMSWRNYKELLTITMDALHNLTKTKAKIAFIGQDSNENIDISISLPYAYYEILYKEFFIYLDMKLMIDLN